MGLTTWLRRGVQNAVAIQMNHHTAYSPMSTTPRKVRTAFQLAHLPAQLFSIRRCAGHSLVFCMASQRRADPVVMLDHADSAAHLALELRQAYPRFAGPLPSLEDSPFARPLAGQKSP